MSILVFLIPIFFTSLLSACQRRSRDYHILMWFFLIPLIVTGLFRWEIGTDWSAYLEIFNAIKSGYDTSYEIGWVSLNAVVSYFGDFRAFIFITYLFIFIFIVLSYFKYRYAITILFFICFYRFGVYFTRVDFAAIVFIFFVSYRKHMLAFSSLLFHKTFIFPPLMYLGMNAKTSRIITFSLIVLLLSAIFHSKLLEIVNSEFRETFETHYVELADLSVNRFKNFLKVSILLAIAILSCVKGYDNRKNLLVSLLLIFVWLVVNFISEGMSRLYALIFPFLYFLVIPRWVYFTLIKRIAMIMLFIMVFAGWAMSPFYNLFFPINLWIYDYL